MSMPRASSMSTSLMSTRGSTTTPLPMTGVTAGYRIPEGTSAGEGLAVDDDAVARVVATLVAHDHVHLFGEEVGELPLALVTPWEPTTTVAGTRSSAVADVPLYGPGPPTSEVCDAAPARRTREGGRQAGDERQRARTAPVAGASHSRPDALKWSKSNIELIEPAMFAAEPGISPRCQFHSMNLGSTTGRSERGPRS